MNFSDSGLIQRFLDILGVDLISATGRYIAFTVTSAFFTVVVVALMLLIFRLIVYLKKG